MTTCTIKLEFSIAKRLVDFGGKCNQLHGYTNAVEVTFTNDKEEDKVADFYDLKETLGTWIDAHWDHNVILNETDRPLGNVIEDLTGQTVYYLPHDPTAENMARHLKDVICPELFSDVRCTHIRLYDNPTAFVEVG